MIGKGKKRITLTLPNEFIEVIDILVKANKSEKATRSIVVMNGISMLYSVVRGFATYAINKDAKEEINNA